MSVPSEQAKAIFLEATERHAPEGWPAFLDQACAGDADLRVAAERLLRARAELGSFHENAGPVLGVTVDAPAGERPGAVIGPYKLLEQIGEGGFGTVFMAEQTHPVRRKVALKVIKAGMDTHQVVARFEAERQALAVLDHPNIAKVFDAGETAGGRPYFVMELVRGVPVTDYCDQAHLTPRERLELFVQVCHAVQHAHQKGIIHRDLKPSNVLVSAHDGKPSAKVIDFGIAKATGHQLTDKTLFTGFAQMVGTPLYMSPEQAGQSPDVDTRSDIYSLGVLLYELLTGSTPFSKERFRQAAYDEIRRIIREEEPPKPSTRLSDSTDSLPSISAQRHTEPAKLTKLVRGELDWIVMKALEKERNRRYETANSFAMDVQRYLADEPVQACPPSATYRLKKFARRNKASLAFTGLILLILSTLTGGIGWNLRDRAARQAAVEQEAILALNEAERWQEQGNWPEALSAAKRAEGLLAGSGSNELWDRVHRLRKDLEMVLRLEVIPLLRDELKENLPDYDSADQAYAKAFTDFGIDVVGLPVEEAAVRIRAHASVASVLVAAVDDWAWVRFQKDRAGGRALRAVAVAAEQDPWRRQVREAARRNDTQALTVLTASPDLIRQPPTSIVVLERVMRTADLKPARIELLRRAQRQYPGDFWINEELAWALKEMGDSYRDEVVSFRRAAVALRPQSSEVHNLLGIALKAQGNLNEAAAAFHKAIELDPKYAKPHVNLGEILRVQGRLDLAVAAFGKAIEIDPKYAHAYNQLGVALDQQEKPKEAIAAFRKAIEIDPKYARPQCNLGKLFRVQGKLREAIDCYRTAIKIDPGYAIAYDGLGQALKKQGNIEEAITNYRKAIDLDPKDAVFRSNLGAILCDVKHDYERAIAQFRKAIELNPKYADGHYNLGCALERQKKQEEAILSYRKAVELDAKSDEFRTGLVKALARTGWDLVNRADPKLWDPKRAVALMNEALELDSRSIFAWQYLGWIQYRTGNWKDSIEALEKSCRLEKGGDEGQWIVLALAHAKLAAQEGLSEKEQEHHKAEARRRYEQANDLIEKRWSVRPKHDNGQFIWDFHLEARKMIGVKETMK